MQHRARALTKTRTSLRRSGSNHGEQGIIIVLVAVFMLGAVGAMAAAPYLHARLSTIDAKLEPDIAEPLSERPLVQVEFVVPGAGHARGDNE